MPSRARRSVKGTSGCDRWSKRSASASIKAGSKSIFGHIGRKPEGSLKAVAARIGELLGQKVPLITDWLDETTLTIPDQSAAVIDNSQPGSVLVLENTRRYAIERALVGRQARRSAEARPAACPVRERIRRQSREGLRERSLSAGSLDSSTTIVPAAMDRVALGQLRRRRIRWPDAPLPQDAIGRFQRPEDRQARRLAGDDRPRHDPLGVRRRLAGDGAQESGRRAGWR